MGVAGAGRGDGVGGVANGQWERMLNRVAAAMIYGIGGPRATLHTDRREIAAGYYRDGHREPLMIHRLRAKNGGEKLRNDGQFRPN